MLLYAWPIGDVSTYKSVIFLYRIAYRGPYGEKHKMLWNSAHAFARMCCTTIDQGILVRRYCRRRLGCCCIFISSVCPFKFRVLITVECRSCFEVLATEHCIVRKERNRIQGEERVILVANDKRDVSMLSLIVFCKYIEIDYRCVCFVCQRKFWRYECVTIYFTPPPPKHSYAQLYPCYT